MDMLSPVFRTLTTFYFLTKDHNNMHKNVMKVENIIIGSGPSGIATAWALIKKGQKVTILDVGEELEQENEGLRSKLESLEPHQWEDDDIKLYTDLKRSKEIDGPKPFGSNFLFRDPINFFNNSSIDNSTGLRPSFAKGGLSNGWGSAILPYRQEDIEGWPSTTIDLTKHYDALREFMPMANKSDELATLFPMLKVNQDSSIPLTTQAQRLLLNLKKKAKKLNQSGIYFGQARQAAESKDCRQCGICLYGCPYGTVYNTRQTLEKLINNSSLIYKKGYFVKQLEEKKEHVELITYDIANKQETVFIAARVYVACGVIPTAKLLMKSLNYYNKPIYMKDSQHFFLPMLHIWRSRKKPNAEKITSLVQLFIEFTDKSSTNKTAHVQIYTFNDLYAIDMQKRFGRFAKLLKPLINLLSQHLIVAQGFLHSDYSSTIEVRLDKDTGVERFKLQPKRNPKTLNTIRSIKKKLTTVAINAGLLPLIPFSHNGNAGSSFHCGSTFPMSDNPTGLQSDTLGRPAGLKRVHIVDASVLPSIPATTITLPVMANAHRIATESCK